MKLFEQPMKIVEKVLEKRIQELMNVDAIQLVCMPRRGTAGTAKFVVGRMQEEYIGEKRLYVCLWIF